ncbi:hypothetical protein PSECIP111951_03274 [Pseudoalteromonas holothuriae]|uniref:Uncharacterized protein n=1 Tax=Pseudoalteromonas holothuriae TaxID=2963714 RepID=A0A9W4R206_9GAMM|nr:hypothetical protein PSECIP111854_03200 [Pseudoalteromonas sp. CIP111854]CAH9065041.1 hypothetical protein PSECIP111951_03274 [Pseudoalteromonas sp. CIP111951]
MTAVVYIKNEQQTHSWVIHSTPPILVSDKITNVTNGANNIHSILRNIK